MFIAMFEQSAPDALLAALSSRDFAAFARCLAPTAQARLALPRGPEVQSGRDDIARRFEGWFAGATDFEVLDTECEPVGPRYRLSWRFRLSRDGLSREVIEQVAFVDHGPGGITEINLLCSGFLPDQQPAQPNVFDAGALGCGDGLAKEFRSRLDDIGVGESLTVIVSDPAAKEDLPALVRMMGQTVASCEPAPGNRLAITVEKSRE
jgi:TusA-related sulfurtransferase